MSELQQQQQELSRVLGIIHNLHKQVSMHVFFGQSYTSNHRWDIDLEVQVDPEKRTKIKVQRSGQDFASALLNAWTEVEQLVNYGAPKALMPALEHKPLTTIEPKPLKADDEIPF